MSTIWRAEPCNAVGIDQGDEIGRRVAAERRSREVGIFRQVAIGRSVQVGEIAAAAAGNQDFLARLFSVIEHDDLPPARGGSGRAEKAGRPCAQDDHIVRHAGCPWAIAWRGASAEW
jgi:hypothetical protein